MKLHPDEMALARAYTTATSFEGLTGEQMRRIMVRGRELFHWFKDHPRTHYAISTAVLAVIFAADYAAQVSLPHAIIGEAATSTTARLVMAAVVAGGLDSWLMYSLSVYSMHEGAAHKMIYPPRGPVTRASTT